MIAYFGYAVKRCPAEMDGVLADAIVHLPATHGIVVDAIDQRWLTERCALRAQRRRWSPGADSARVKERAGDALLHSCKIPG